MHTTKSVAMQNETDFQQLQKINQALISEYFCAYLVDVKAGTFVHMGTKANVFHLERGNINEALKRYLRMSVNPMYKSAMSLFTDISSLPERLKQQDVLVRDFLTIRHGWTRARWFVIDRDEWGCLHHVIFAMKDVDEEIIRLTQAQQEMRRHVALIEQQKRDLEKAKQEAEDANAAKSSFLFNMSYDIRTPMNAILGFTHLMEKYMDDKQRLFDYLGKIKDSSRVLLELINNVLEVSRIEKGKLVMEETAMSVGGFNDIIYTVFQDQMKSKGIHYTRSIDVQDHYIFADQNKLRQVLINIVSNAMKYTQLGGHVEMNLRQIPYDKEGWGMFEMRVSDNGIGMSKEFIPHLFEAFVREHNTTEAKVEGTGLGMVIVKRLVDFMNGTIDVESEQGKGTTFILRLPHRIARREDVVEVSESDKEGHYFVGKRILLAEDNDLNAEIAIEILKEVGIVVERASDGQECVDMLCDADADHYDVILMDIQMPFMNGYEATKTIRLLEDKEKAEIPILAMTANAYDEDRRNAIKVGMNGHLAKPINIEVLFNELRRVLR